MQKLIILSMVVFSMRATDPVIEHYNAFVALEGHVAQGDITPATAQSSPQETDDSLPQYSDHWGKDTGGSASCSAQGCTDEQRITVVGLGTLAYTILGRVQPEIKIEKATQQAAEDLERYTKAFEKLQSCKQLQALGSGFGIGILSAVYNRACGIDVENKLSWLATAAATLGVLAYQNHVDSAKVPMGAYFDTNLVKCDNLFGSTSRFTVARAVGSLFAASLGYFGTDYVLKQVVGERKGQSARSAHDEDAWWLEDTYSV